MDKETIAVSDKTNILLNFINLFLNFPKPMLAILNRPLTLLSENQNQKCSQANPGKRETASKVFTGKQKYFLDREQTHLRD
jgi:hypothetical protein